MDIQVPRITIGLKGSLLLRADAPSFSSKSGGLLRSLVGKVYVSGFSSLTPPPRASLQALTWANAEILLQRKNSPV